MRVLVIGAGRLGRALAHDLLRSGHDVRMLDADAGRIARASGALAERTVQGCALSRETLERAAGGCDAVAVVTTDDAYNAVVALAARRELGVPTSVAVVGSPGRAQALTGLGAHIVCSTSRAAGEILMTLVRSDVEIELALGAETGVYRVEPRHGSRAARSASWRRTASCCPSRSTATGECSSRARPRPSSPVTCCTSRLRTATSSRR